MSPDGDAILLRPYQAIIWGPEPESVGVRAVYFAADGDDARRQAEQEHGEHCTFSIWNEEDAARHRGICGA